MYKFILILHITAALLSSGCSNTEQKRELQKNVTPAINCESLKTGLPQSDPMFSLKGKVKTNGRYTHEIIQLGKIGTYHEYFVRSPCGQIPFYQISTAEFVSSSRKYKVTLKNGKSYSTNTNIPFSRRDPDKKYFFNTLVGSNRDKEKKSWLWYVTKDPRYKEPREVSLDPAMITSLHIN